MHLVPMFALRLRGLQGLCALGALTLSATLTAQTRAPQSATQNSIAPNKSTASKKVAVTKPGAAATVAKPHVLDFASEGDLHFSSNSGQLFAFFDPSMKSAVLSLTLDGSPLQDSDGSVTWTVEGDDGQFTKSRDLFDWGGQTQGPLQGAQAKVNLRTKNNALTKVTASLKTKDGATTHKDIVIQVFAAAADTLKIVSQTNTNSSAPVTDITLASSASVTLKANLSFQNSPINGRVVWHLQATGDPPVQLASSSGTTPGADGYLVAPGDATISVKALRAGTGTLIVSSGNANPVTINVAVTTSTAKLTLKPDTLTIHENETASAMASLTDANGSAISGGLQWHIDDPNIVEFADTSTPPDSKTSGQQDGAKAADTTAAQPAANAASRQLRGKKSGTTTLTVSYKSSDGNPVNASITITVLPATGLGLYGPSTLIQGQAIKLTVEFPNATKSEVDQIALTNEDLITNPNNDHTQLITARVDSEDRTRHTIVVTGVTPGFALLEVKVKTPGGTQLDTSIQLTVAAVSSFQKLKVSMDLMDDQMAADLFGTVASREFYVARVRLFNNLPQDPTSNFVGDSLLAYSSSIEAGIKLEKRYDRGLRTHIDPSRLSDAAQHSQWEPVTEGDIEEDYSRALENDENSTHGARSRLGQSQDSSGYKASLDDPNSGTTVFEINLPGRTKQVNITDNRTGKPLNPQWLQWNSSRPEVAGVDNNGLVTAREAGITVITGTAPDGVVYAIEVTVTGPIENPQMRSRLVPTEAIEINQAITLSVRGVDIANRPSGGQARRIKWFSTNPRIAKVITAAAIRDNKLASPAATTGQISQPITQEHTLTSPNDQSLPGAIPDDPNKCLVRALYPGSALIIAFEDDDDGKDEELSSHNPIVVFAEVVRVRQPEAHSLPPSVFIEDNKLRYLRHKFRYRPYNYELMVNTVDSRDIRSTRSQAFQMLSLVGTVASIVSPLIKSSSTTASDSIAAYNGALLPALQKLFPSMSETQRQNVVNLTMKPIEEIPFGADINRVLFFPKHPFRGILPGYWTRIGEIDTSYFNITVAVVKKTQQTTENAASTTTQP